MSDNKNLKIELYHDSLAKRIFEKASRQEKMRLQLERMIKDRFNIFQSQKNVFLSKEELALIGNYVEESTLEDDQVRFVQTSRERIERKAQEEVEQLRKQNELLERKRVLQRRLNWFLVVFILALLVLGGLSAWSYFYGKRVYADSLFSLAKLHKWEKNEKLAIDQLTEVLRVSRLFWWSPIGDRLNLEARRRRLENYSQWRKSKSNLDSLDFNSSNLIYNPDFRQYVYLMENEIEDLTDLINLVDDDERKSYYHFRRGDLLASLYFRMGTADQIANLINTSKPGHADFPLDPEKFFYQISDFAEGAEGDFVQGLKLSESFGNVDADSISSTSAPKINREVFLDTLAILYLGRGDSIGFNNFIDQFINEPKDEEILIGDLIWSADYFSKNRSFSLAVKTVQRLIELVPDLEKPEFYGYLADIYENVEEYEEAISAVEKARDLTVAQGRDASYYEKKIQHLRGLENPGLLSGAGELLFEEFRSDNETLVRVSGYGETLELTKAKKGYYTFGDYKIQPFLEEYRSFLLDSMKMDTSVLSVLESVVHNEGNANTVLTTGSHALSFGIYFWPLGLKSKKGALPALLRRFKMRFPAQFDQYFGSLGVDISNDTDARSGYLELNGKKIRSAILKEQFRTPQWAFHFWRAGNTPEMFATQLLHAIDGLQNFYYGGKEIYGNSLSQIITSEYGVALLLDNYRYRPGYVRDCLKEAMDQTGLLDPGGWTSQEEQMVLETYVKNRPSFGKYPMEDALYRAKMTQSFLDRGILSAERGSFQHKR